MLCKWWKNKKMSSKTNVTQEAVKSVLEVPIRTQLTFASGLSSSYTKKHKPTERWDVKVFKEGALVVPGMFFVLMDVEKEVRNQGGTFYITELFRSWSTQATARKAYESGEKSPYVAKPGKSFHNAGRAVDFSVHELNFPNRPKEDHLKILWDIVKPLGFTPIIDKPDPDLSESWHLDWMEDTWHRVYKNMGYDEAAKCSVLDIGRYDPDVPVEKVVKMFCQAQLLRLGYYDAGIVDGIFGNKTKTTLNKLGLSDKSLAELADLLADL